MSVRESFVRDVIEPETYETGTVKYPTFSVCVPMMANIAKFA
jgi:hypothetical protein